MKILMLAFDFPPRWGGVATYGWELASEFHKLGHDVTVMSAKRGEQMGSDFKQVRVSLPSTGIAAIPALTSHLFFHLSRNEYDFIFCNLWLPEGVALYFTQQLTRKKTPYSISVHAMEIVESSENLKKRFRKKLSFLKKPVFQEAQNIFCVSEFTKALLEKQVREIKGKPQVIANGANPDIFKNNNTKSSHPIIFSACRLLPNKGVDQLVKSMPGLLKKHPNLELRVSGEGPDRQRLDRLVKMLYIEDNVHFLGKISLEDLVDEYNKAHLFALLSRQQNHYVEGFGLVFLEAALCGTPSLGGNSGGIPDAVLDGQTGWLIDPYDSEKIESRLDELLSSTDELAKIGQQAQTHTLETRTWNHCAQKLLASMEKCQ